jgi:magnesium chelatase accessory protein
VRVAGRGPAVLLLHGSGASAHSWAGLGPLLESRSPWSRRTCRATAAPAPCPRADVAPGFAAGVAELLRTLRLRPELVVGHSAGAAVGARLALDDAVPARGIVALAPALAAMDAGGPLRPLLNALFTSGPTARILAALASGPLLDRALDATGSALGADGIEAYRRLATDPAHVNAVMTMFANWDVEPLVADYPRLRVPVVLAFGAGDRWIDRAAVERATARIPDARPVEIPGGHLAHEEHPAEVARLVLALAGRRGCSRRRETEVRKCESAKCESERQYGVRSTQYATRREAAVQFSPLPLAGEGPGEGAAAHASAIPA